MLKHWLGKLLFPKTSRIQKQFAIELAGSVKEIAGFDRRLSDIAETWLATGPYLHFVGLFIEARSWNIAFRNALMNAKEADLKECFRISQAYYLYFLNNLIENSDEYSKYSKDDISANILNNMNNGKDILEKESDFKNLMLGLQGPEEIALVYVFQILDCLYGEDGLNSAFKAKIKMDPGACLSVLVYTKEHLKRFKDIGLLGVAAR